MPPDYPFDQLLSDVMSVVTQNSPTVIAIACYLAAVNFIIGWFHYALEIIIKRPFKD